MATETTGLRQSTDFLKKDQDRFSEDIVDSYDVETLQLHRDLAVWYYKKLNEQYDYLMSDEAIAEHIIYNELEFNYEDN